MAQRRRLDADAATGLTGLLARLLAPEGLARFVFSADGPAAIVQAAAIARRHWRLAGHPERSRILSSRQIPPAGWGTVAAVIARPEACGLRLRDLRRRHGFLVIADETVTGFGRTGLMFGSRGWGFSPDLMALAGPLGITAAGDGLHGLPGDGRRGRQGACVAALERIAAIVDGNLAGNAARQGALLLGVLRRRAETSDLIGRVHGSGLLICIDLVADKPRRIPLAANDPRCEAVMQACAGLPVHLAGSRLMLMPPLTLSAEDTAGMAARLIAILA